jgi:hypothetical protein
MSTDSQAAFTARPADCNGRSITAQQHDDQLW